MMAIWRIRKSSYSLNFLTVFWSPPPSKGLNCTIALRRLQRTALVYLLSKLLFECINHSKFDEMSPSQKAKILGAQN
jgi:hypothetical protein